MITLDDDNGGVYDDVSDGGRRRIGDTPDYGDEDEGEEDGDGILACECGAALADLDHHFILPCGVMCTECAEVHVGICAECMAEWEEPEVSYAPAVRSLSCACGKLDPLDGTFYHAHALDAFCFGCMALHRRGCKACASTWADDFKPMATLFDGVAEGRAAAAAEHLGESLTAQLITSKPSISQLTGAMESKSPLFRNSPANPQLSMF